GAAGIASVLPDEFSAEAGGDLTVVHTVTEAEQTAAAVPVHLEAVPADGGRFGVDEGGHQVDGQKGNEADPAVLVRPGGRQFQQVGPASFCAAERLPARETEFQGTVGDGHGPFEVRVRFFRAVGVDEVRELQLQARADRPVTGAAGQGGARLQVREAGLPAG